MRSMALTGSIVHLRITNAFKPFVFLAVMLALCAAGPSARVLGIGLDMTATDIARQLKAAPGLVDTSERLKAGGAIERRFTLVGGTFVRAFFPSTGDVVRPDALSFALSESVEPAAILREMEQALGPPASQSGSAKGGAVRRVWGGRPGEEGAILPRRDADIVAEFVFAPAGLSSALLARPRWFTEKRSP